jgi:hypothetical protein
MENDHPATHAMRRRQSSMQHILAMLQGGDRRSIGKSNEIVSMVLKEPKLFDALFSGIQQYC